MKSLPLFFLTVVMVVFSLSIMNTDSMFAQDNADVEAYFVYPKDANVDELLTFLKEFSERKESPVSDEKDGRAKALEFLRRCQQTQVEIALAILEKQPNDEQLLKMLARLENTLNIWRQILATPDDPVYVAAIKKLAAASEKLQNEKHSEMVNQKILVGLCYVYWLLGNTGDRSYSEKAIKKIDEYLPNIKSKFEHLILLELKTRAWKQVHENDQSIESFKELEKIHEDAEKLNPSEASPRFVLEQDRIDWYAKRNGKIEDIRASLDFIKSEVLNKESRRAVVIDWLKEQLTAIGQNSGKPDYYETVLTEFQTAYRESGNEQLQKYARKIDGRKRFQELPGHEMKIEGYFINGTKFDWEPFRGKVVLIDFWATWCGPCLGEVPNMKANWEKYHDRGFEIIGIAVWDKTETVKEHLQKSSTLWTILDDQQFIDAGNESITDYYGIDGIPTMVLIGRDGKVIALETRGQQLNEELEKLFPKEKH